jgi:glycyl-tRNA synthetase (class II)
MRATDIDSISIQFKNWKNSLRTDFDLKAHEQFSGKNYNTMKK